MADETSPADRWLFATLDADVDLRTALGGPNRVWQEEADQGAPMPYAVFIYQGGSDVWGHGAARVMANLLYLVKVVGIGSFAELRTAADRIDAALQGKSGVAADGQVFGCVRERIVRYPERHEGKTYRHRGGMYRLYAQSS